MEQQFQQVINTVMQLPSNQKAAKIASNYGLNITSVSWEDCARDEDSCVGPNISDMTLQIQENCLPVIRNPNFSDLTWDIPMENIPLLVGNETGDPLYQITLKEYLEHLRIYLHDPSSWPGESHSLLAPERDSHVVASAQACLLPVIKGAESVFNVCLYNYQSTAENPAVLAIVATSNGTSAQIVDEGVKKLFFNNNGQRASFVAQRLSDNRKERGASEGGAMSQQEKAQNLVMIIQVPLICENIFCEGCSSDESCEDDGGEEDDCDIEDAIIKVGANEGEYTEIDGKKMERDPAYPVRVTLQYYKATSNAEVTDEVMFSIAQQLTKAQEQGDGAGSLVAPGNSGRPTEWIYDNNNPDIDEQ